MVATVSAYAEALGEQVQLAEQLQAALGQAVAKSRQDTKPVLASARAVARAALKQEPSLPPTPPLLDALRALTDALHTFDGGVNEGG